MPQLRISDDERANFVQSTDVLWQDWRRTRLPLMDFVRSHRYEIDRAIRSLFSGGGLVVN